METLAKYAGVPVYNGLTDEYHPTQMIADIMTMRENLETPIETIRYAYLGDTRSNMGHSLMLAGCLMGMDVRICGPRQLWPEESFVDHAKRLQAQSGARLTITDDVQEAVKGAEFVHTDVWVSMGEPKEIWAERIKLLKPYRVSSGSDARDRQCTCEVHALPAGVPRHRDQGRPRHRRAAWHR